MARVESADRGGRPKKVVLDLRGNGGGYVDAVTRLAGGPFESEVHIASLKGRKGSKPLASERTKAKRRRFSDQLMLLVDGDSASSAELLARLVQLEKRGRSSAIAAPAH